MSELKNNDLDYCDAKEDLFMYVGRKREAAHFQVKAMEINEAYQVGALVLGVRRRGEPRVSGLRAAVCDDPEQHTTRATSGTEHWRMLPEGLAERLGSVRWARMERTREQGKSKGKGRGFNGSSYARAGIGAARSLAAPPGILGRYAGLQGEGQGPARPVVGLACPLGAHDGVETAPFQMHTCSYTAGYTGVLHRADFPEALQTCFFACRKSRFREGDGRGQAVHDDDHQS